MTPRDRDALLSAYRAERGPSRAQAEKLWVRLSEDVADPSSEGRVAGPVSQRGRAVAIAAFVLAAAAIAVLVLRPSGRRVKGEAAEPPSMAAHGADADREAATELPRSRAAATSDLAVDDGALQMPASPSVEPESERVGPRATSQPGRTTTRPRATPRGLAPADPEPGTSPSDSLAEETALLRRARSALSAGRPAVALELLEDYDQRFASPRLAEEAEAVRTMARCRQSPADPGALSAAFFERHPGSLFRKQVDAACAASAPADGG